MFSILIENAALNDFVELKITDASATDFMTYRRSDVGSIVMLPSTEKKPDSLISKINILMLKSANLHFYIPDEIADDVYRDIISVTVSENPVRFSKLHEVEDEVVITSEMISELRDRAGVGMMECKRSLLECAGVVEAAYDALTTTES